MRNIVCSNFVSVGLRKEESFKETHIYLKCYDSSVRISSFHIFALMEGGGVLARNWTVYQVQATYESNYLSPISYKKNSR